MQGVWGVVGIEMKFLAFVTRLCAALLVFDVALAENPKVSERFSGTTVGFDVPPAFSNATLTVVGPNDYSAQTFAKQGAPAIDLKARGAVADGLYTYQIHAASGLATGAAAAPDNGRTASAATRLQSVEASGSFRVQGGAILPRETASEPRTKRDRK